MCRICSLERAPQKKVVLLLSAESSSKSKKGPGESDVLLRHWSHACAHKARFRLMEIEGVRTACSSSGTWNECQPIKSVEIVFAPIRLLKRRGCQHHSDKLKRFCTTHLLPTTTPSSKDLDCILIISPCSSCLPCPSCCCLKLTIPLSQLRSLD